MNERTVIFYGCDCGHTTDVEEGVSACAGCGKPFPPADTKPPAWAAAYFQDVRELLGIGADWHLWLSVADEVGEENDADGQCTLEARYLKAQITIRRGLSEARTREVIMHELLHVALAPISLAAERARDLVPMKLYAHAAFLYTDAEEQVIERLTRALQAGIKLPTPLLSGGVTLDANGITSSTFTWITPPEPRP